MLAALVIRGIRIRGIRIRGFDYSRTRKQGKPSNSKRETQFQTNLWLNCEFWYSQIIISQERNHST